MSQPVFSEHMLYAPTNKFNDAEESICSEEKSSGWWWNEQVPELNFVLATIILTTSLGMAAIWGYNCPFIRHFRPDTSYKQFVRQAGMASIFESRKHPLDY
jgi:hypothetical protein